MFASKAAGILFSIAVVLLVANYAHTAEQPVVALKAEVVDCASATPAVEVIMKDFGFDPMEIKVPAGSVVKWNNIGPTSHMITSGAPGQNAGALFRTGFVGINKAACVKFVNPGIYDYFCLAHGNLMKDGKVVVE